MKTAHIALLGALLVALSNGENIRSLTAKSAQTGTRKTEHKDRVKRDKERARDAKDLSATALDRYRQNCIMVLDQTTGKEVYFAPGMTAIDSGLGRSVRESAAVCNKLGDTALIVNGVMEEIASVDAEDLDKLAAILERRGYRMAGPSSAPAAPKPSPSPTASPKPKHR
ncbi:MAG: hypothetical protein HC860_18730 [Alkalinema sp. RU_4_3]|nr:hypothetical protein [Alkalinema sp. RU_4_3]NJR70435.1 hypothetical protein [Synechococcales cyanobacterium CRU_2_2]